MEQIVSCDGFHPWTGACNKEYSRQKQPERNDSLEGMQRMKDFQMLLFSQSLWGRFSRGRREFRLFVWGKKKASIYLQHMALAMQTTSKQRTK